MPRSNTPDQSALVRAPPAGGPPHPPRRAAPRSVGGALRACIEQAQTVGGSALSLRVEDGNDAVLGLYERHHFRVVGQTGHSGPKWSPGRRLCRGGSLVLVTAAPRSDSYSIVTASPPCLTVLDGSMSYPNRVTQLACPLSAKRLARGLAIVSPAPPSADVDPDSTPPSN
jgi:hypothetical protein